MLKLPVAPAVRPTVPSADTASYRASVKTMGEVALINTPPNRAKLTIIKAMVMASSTCPWGMVRWNTQTRLLPLALEARNSTSTMKVTVFRPPAVEPEEPPMSI